LDQRREHALDFRGLLRRFLGSRQKFTKRKARSTDKAGMDILGIAQQGLDQAQGQFDQTARQIAQTSLNMGPPPADSVSLSDEAVSLISTKNDYETNLSVAHVADEMQQSTLNLLA
jgi:hypothetical protein